VCAANDDDDGLMGFWSWYLGFWVLGGGRARFGNTLKALPINFSF